MKHKHKLNGEEVIQLQFDPESKNSIPTLVKNIVGLSQGFYHKLDAENASIIYRGISGNISYAREENYAVLNIPYESFTKYIVIHEDSSNFLGQKDYFLNIKFSGYALNEYIQSEDLKDFAPPIINILDRSLSGTNKPSEDFPIKITDSTKIEYTNYDLSSLEIKIKNVDQFDDFSVVIYLP